MSAIAVCVLAALVARLPLTMAAPVEILDMSYIMDDTTQYWGVGVQAAPQLEDVAKKTGHSGIRANNFCSGEHVGTHIDAPKHVEAPGAKEFLHDMKLQNLYGPAIRIDIREQAKRDRNYALTIGDIVEHEKEHGQIPQRAAIFTCSDWAQYWGDSQSYFGGNRSVFDSWNFPAFSKEATEWLITHRDILGLAVDTPSCDTGRVGATDIVVHKALFSKNRWCMENVAHTCELPPTGATVYAFPNKVRGGSGAPLRVVAFIGSAAPPMAFNVSLVAFLLLCLLM